MNINQHVYLASTFISCCGHRTGTVFCDLATFSSRFGNPHSYDPDGDKVTTVWTIKTPRGVAEIRDYWWNKGVLSIASSNNKAALWVAKWAREHGLEAKAAISYS